MKGSRLPWILFFIVLAFATYRMLAFVYNFAPILLFSDRLGTYAPLFLNEGIWAGFAKQHGPHRMGIIYFFFSISAWLGNWNGQWDLYMQAILYTLTAIFALWLKKVLFNTLTLFDLLIVLIFMNLNVGTTLLTSPFVHGIVPLFGILLCLIYAKTTGRKQLILLSIFSFFSGFTGFGFVLLPLIVLIQLSGLKKNQSLKLNWLKLLPALTSTVVFSYIFITNIPNKAWTHETVSFTIIVKYTIVLFSNMYMNALKEKQLWLMLLLSVLALFYFSWAFYKDRLQLSIQSKICLIVLFGTYFIFNVLNTYGRANLGLENALASRYIPIGMIGSFSIYLLLTSIKSKPIKTILLLFFALLILRPQIHNQGRMLHFKKRSNEFKQFENCLRNEPEVTNCLESAVSLGIHPNPERTRLKEKLQFLKEQQLEK